MKLLVWTLQEPCIPSIFPALCNQVNILCLLSFTNCLDPPSSCGTVSSSAEFLGCSPQHHVWSQWCAADFSRGNSAACLPGSSYTSYPTLSGDRSLGAGLLLMGVCRFSFSVKGECWFPVRLSWQTPSLLLSTSSASCFSTWSCCHLYWPCVSAVLQPART